MRPVCVRVAQVLALRIYSTWGDPHYVGLAGLDFFDSAGNLVDFKDREVPCVSPSQTSHVCPRVCVCAQSAIRADPPDVNVLEGYGGDPRTVDNLLDGVNNTCDDLHVWLAPFTPGKVNTITVTFDARVSLSMIRVWNYNKSRIHSYRGVRLVCVELDGTRVFEGEIRKAMGATTSIEANSEVILFTRDARVLKCIETCEVRRLREEDDTEGDATGAVVEQVLKQLEEARPRTGEKGGVTSPSRCPLSPPSYPCACVRVQ